MKCLPAVLAALFLPVLVGCATGTAEEARLGQARDAATDPELPNQQATRTAERFFPTPARPTPANPPIPALGELVITLAVDGGVPQASYASVPTDGGTLYAAALLTNLSDKQVVSAVWVDAVGSTISTARVEVDGNVSQGWIALPLGSLNTVAPGEYAIYLFVDERRLSSLLFQVTPAGSGGVALPARPENPNADRGGPGEVRNQPGGEPTPGSQNPSAPAVDPNAPVQGGQPFVPTPGAP